VYLIQGLSLGVSAAASPGPFQAFLINRSLNLGWRRTLPGALAPLISDGPIITLVLLLLTRFPPLFLRGVQVVGGVYVIFLAWKSFQSFRAIAAPIPEAAPPTRQTLWQAVAMNFLSPGPYLFWSLLAGPLLVRGWGERPLFGVTFVAGFYTALVGGMALLVVLFGAARELGPRANRALLGLSAVLLLGFGLLQLWQGFQG
jgi:threonine/homoserine/homoserine lactone efflux protein